MPERILFCVLTRRMKMFQILKKKQNKTKQKNRTLCLLITQKSTYKNQESKALYHDNGKVNITS